MLSTHPPSSIADGRLPRARRGAAIVTAGLAAAVLAGGCGGGSETPSAATTASTASTTATASTSPLASLSADQILTEAKAAATGAKSVHVVGQIVQSAGTSAFDLKLTDQPGATGTIELGGGVVEVVRIDGDVYFKADEKTLASGLGESSAELAKLVAGKYIKGPLTDPRLTGFTQLTSLKDFTANVLDPSGSISRVDGKPVDGVATVGLRNDDKDNGGTLYVADAKEPFPLLIEALSGRSDTGNLRMKEWNADVTVTAPPPDEVIDLSQLGNGATP
jgi:hypothetical protein